ncbi:MAG: sterol desaturase family protein [Saprospiraceae bacterium]|nr:sterol desaturase family protein [Saprospiraceae bacterium]
MIEKVFHYLTNLNPDIFMAFILAFLFSLEQIFTGVSSLIKRTPHLINNIILQIGYVLLNLGLATLVLKVLNWTDANKYGLFNIIELPYYMKVIFGVFCIDLTYYFSHRLAHTWELFWRLHRVHHSDIIMDSSTTYRFHPLDAILDNLATVTAAVIFGLDGTILIFWLILYMPLLVLHHTSFIMPSWFDRTFGKIIVSPNFHKIHHHQEQRFTDSNYGLIFIFWDKLFKTYKEIPVSEIKYGLSEFDNPVRQKFWYLLKSPFINVKK